MTFKTLVLLAAILAVYVSAQNLVICNDDGWATAQIRAQYESLSNAGYNVVLSCPALNQSGTGSLSKTPTPMTVPCEFDTCPIGSPAEGYNASDPHLNYVNGYPADSAQHGVEELAPKFFGGSAPDFVVSGPNIGTNLNLATQFSGTIGAASTAAKLGVPAVAFSGSSGSQVSYMTLSSDANATSTLAARVYASLTTYFVQTLLSAAPDLQPTSILPNGTILNVNYPAIDDCPDVSDYKWVFSRNLWNPLATDVETCGSTHLPDEVSVVDEDGCYASVSVLGASSKTDVDSGVQAEVLAKLQGLPLSCLP
ncbi:survival protein sure-like phosphatase/nucleotidase [Daedalea quercina L-15889]|uniref:Survival protein sure-like phosphatase/nucleotidase n=1 Tax=Daedalea quercina L-15889 TaxID=1314783 RepID=A0A165QGY0_9APHY|nr:survival protein sure-like phosphatase/nucleotidase [Daedalea quercina L-15889]